MAVAFAAIGVPFSIVIGNQGDKIDALERRSKADMAELETRLTQQIRDLDERGTAGVIADIARLKERDREAETQFSASAELNNLNADHTHTLLALLWRQVYGKPLPERRVWPGFMGKKYANGGNDGSH